MAYREQLHQIYSRYEDEQQQFKRIQYERLLYAKPSAWLSCTQRHSRVSF